MREKTPPLELQLYTSVGPAARKNSLVFTRPVNGKFCRVPNSCTVLAFLPIVMIGAERPLTQP
jgi:hypothetical protein